MDRRIFLSGSVAFLSTLALSSCATRVPGLKYPGQSRGQVFLILKGYSGTVLRVLSLDDYSFRDFPLSVSRPHSILQSSHKPSEIYVFGVEETSAILNLETGSERIVQSSSGMRFSGHGLPMKEGVLWSSEINQQGQIYLRGRRTDDFSLIRDKNYTLEGGHHIVRLPGTDTLVTGGFSQVKKANVVTFYDSRKNEIIREFRTNYTPVHFVPLSGTEVASVSSDVALGKSPGKGRPMGGLDLSNPAPVLTFNVNGDSQIHWEEKNKDLYRFGFGIEKLPSGNLVTGHNRSDTLLIWENFQVVKTLSVPMPFALMCTKDGSQLVVHSGVDVRIYSLKTYELEKVISYPENIIAMSAYH